MMVNEEKTGVSDILNSHVVHSAALWCWSFTQIIHLLGSVSRVIEHGESNRMSVQSIAIVFGPTLLRPQTESANMTVHMVFQSQIVELMLNEFQYIFSQTQEDPLGVPLVTTRTLWGLSGKPLTTLRPAKKVFQNTSQAKNRKQTSSAAGVVTGCPSSTSVP